MNLDDLKRKWAGLKPTTRGGITLFAVLVTLTLCSMLILGPSNGSKKRPAGSKPDPKNTVNLTLPQRRDVTVEGLSASDDALKARLDQMEHEQKAQATRDAELRRQLDEERSKAQPGLSPEDKAQIKLLQEEVARIKSAPINAAAQPNMDTPLDEPKVAEAPQLSLRVVKGDESPKANTTKQNTTPPIAYLTPGTMFEADLLNGMDAPTSQVTRKNPVPAVMRVKTDAVLPNYHQMDIKECFVVISGYGVLATERAELRTETMSCISNKGEVFESKIEGYVVGEDGKVGLRGRLISKQGSLIAKSLMAGFLSGVGQAMTPTRVPQLNINPSTNSQYQTTGLDTALETGMGKGISTAAKEVSSFYLDMAKETFPVVEIDAMRRATVILVSGAELKGAIK